MQLNQDYKQLLSEVIKKQIVILGPDITLSKARNVKGLVVANDGTVTSYEGQPQAVTQALIDQFVQLSGLIVKKTMEPLLSMSQAPIQSGQTPAQSAPLPPASPAVPAQSAPKTSTPTQTQAAPTQTTPPPANPTPATTGSQEQLQPAKNPLAA